MFVHHTFNFSSFQKSLPHDGCDGAATTTS